MKLFLNCAFAPALALLLVSSTARAEDGKPFDIGEKYVLTSPANWVVKTPKSKIIEYEFEIPAAEGDTAAGRATVMGAGGSIEDNIKRWEGQFLPADGAEVKAEIKKFKAANQDVHFVDLKGTYKDSPGGPFAGGATVERENYRMLGAVIVTKDDEGKLAGQYFVKLYGPEKTIAAAKPGFEKMLEGLKAK
jgi:hypothetical protein